jgi:hypothetical protein
MTFDAREMRFDIGHLKGSFAGLVLAVEQCDAPFNPNNPYPLTHVLEMIAMVRRSLDALEQSVGRANEGEVGEVP